MQVLIVGAGPVGLTMAAELSRYGVAVRLIDKAPEPTSTSKALVIWARTLELMDRMGCTQSFLDAGLRAHHASMRNGGHLLGQAEFEVIDSAYNFALMIPQSRTERLLADHLATFGVSVERRTELLDFVDTGDHVEARLKRGDGSEETMITPWIIGCDGAHSAVRHRLGVDFKGSAQPDDWMLADVRLAGDKAPPSDEVAIYLHRDGPFVIFPIPGGRARVIATVGKSDPAHPRPDPTLAEVQAMIDERAGGGFTASDPAWLSNFRINERKVASYRGGRALLAGDAAHIHSPAGGQGMNTGMQDAINLSWKLAMVLHGQAAPALIDSYSPERSAVGDMVLRNATLLTDMATLANPAAQAIRNFALHTMLGFDAARHKLANTMSEIEIAYADSPLSRGHRAGERLPPEHYDGPVPGSGSKPRFVLFSSEGEQAESLISRYPSLLESRRRTPPNGNGILIARPDGYIGFAAKSEDWTAADEYMRQIAAH